MGKVYIIHKSSRIETVPYDGPTCEIAGIKGGIFYGTKEEAEKDAKLLTDANPVGFHVKELVIPENTRL